MAGRKHEITLEVNQQTGEIKVLKDAGLDVVVISHDGTATILNPRGMLILGRDQNGTVTTKEVPENTKVTVIKVGEKQEEPEAPKEDK
jgi:hypothetical protein